MDMMNAKVAADKLCEELKARCQELDAGQNLSEPARRAVVEEYMKSSYFKSVRQEMARRAAATIREDLRARNPSLDLSFMSICYGIGPEPLATATPGGSEPLPPVGRP